MLFNKIIKSLTTKLNTMKKLLIIALMLIFTLPTFAQQTPQDTSKRQDTTKTTKKKHKKDNKNKTYPMKRDTSTRDTTHRNMPQ
jgi:hypothetical protein